MTNPDQTVGTNAGFNGRTTPNAMNDILGAFSRGRISGWTCTPKNGMTIQLGGNGTTRDVAIAEDNAGNRLTINNRTATPVEITLAGAPATGNRIDSIVAYIANPPQGAGATSVDFPDAVGIIAVQGTAAGTPSAPNETTIRAGITADGASGASAYYVVLANITVGQGVTTIGSGAISAGAYAQLSTNIVDPTPADGSITTAKLANLAVTTANLANGAVTAAKLAPDATGMVYLGKTVLTAAATQLDFTIPTTYDNYKVLAKLKYASASSAWLDFRMLDSADTAIHNYHQVQRVTGTTWGCAINQDVSYAINSTGGGSDQAINLDTTITKSASDWITYQAQLDVGGGTTFTTNRAYGRNASATSPSKLCLIGNGTFAVGGWIKVWGWNNS